MHKLIIVLANGDSIGQPFYIKDTWQMSWKNVYEELKKSANRE